MADAIANNLHQHFMARALRLAANGLYTTSPNPRVGCVLVKDGRIVGRGYHRFAGQAHAEVDELARHLLAHARVLHRVDGVEDDGDAAAAHVSVAVRHDGHHDEVLDVIADVPLLTHGVLKQRQNDARTLILAL